MIENIIYSCLVIIITILIIEIKVYNRKMSKKKCNCKKCKDIREGVKDIKEGRTTTYKSIDEWEHERTIWKNMHPIRYKIEQVYYSISRFFVRIGDFFLYDIKAFIQRGRRGFAQRDTWGFDSYLAKVISEGIDSLIKELHGHPCDLKNLKQWKSILKKISKTFKIANTTEDCKRTKKQKKDYEEGWKLFKEYFRGLWD